METIKDLPEPIFINEKKILDYLMIEKKLALVGVDERHSIVIKSTFTDLKKLCEFVEPLNYYVSYLCSSIYIFPKNN